ncbi:hypothetical protein EQU24_08710 [Methylotuvimicrobium buryatense]|uniref:Uncharacterized protein n=1 Tax=Methylotuvimicrobium buryatense TaxID=95641 RepID=A0A4P9UTK0_METBY|nr:hypothetical protein EQU24_08710 [Methylotuvimicrobium buryatense]
MNVTVSESYSRYIPFALQISAVPEEAPGCPTKALPAWSWHRAYMDVFTASFDGHPDAEI